MSHRFVRTAIILGAATALVSGGALGGELAKKGSTTYLTNYIYHPVGVTETPGVGKVTALILIGTTTNTKGEAAFDKMSTKCHAIKVETGGKTYLDGACAMTDSDGDSVFSTFDTREVDKSQQGMDCGTHFITGGTGKYKGIIGTEPFSCKYKSPPADMPPDSMNAYAVDVVHNPTWEIK
jgi:hypothetical protein